MQYGCGGVIALLLHLAVLALLVEFGGFAAIPVVATVIGFIIGSAFNYRWQYWTFSASGRHGPRLRRYAAVTTATLILNALLFELLRAGVGVPYLAAQAVTTGVIFLLNFEINRRYTFAG